MTVSIFGSSYSKTSTTKNYIDSKFISLIKNINAKLDKSGDSMKGNLDMGNSKISNLHHPEGEKDVVNKKYVDDLDEEAKSYVDSREAIVRTYIDSRMEEAKSYVDSSEAIVKTYIDSRMEEAKSYVDAKYFKNSVGLIPDLTTIKRNKSGYIATASVNNSQAWEVFNSWKNDWSFTSFPVEGERWIKVKCIEHTQIHKFTIRGRESTRDMEVGQITDWKFQGSNNDSDWDDLYVGNNSPINWVLKTFVVTSTKKYIYYRFIILRMVGENIGLNHLQIYSVDPVI
jgi:hypothetical protein